MMDNNQTEGSHITAYIGWDPREKDAFLVCQSSMLTRSAGNVDVRSLSLSELRKAGLYTRPTEIRDGRLWDVISEAPMSTEFAITRFFVPHVAQRESTATRWVLFCDCDFLWLGDVRGLLAYADPAKALICVQHNYCPTEAVKMDGQPQLHYSRKNWSSMMLYNVQHPAHNRLTLDVLNGVPGRDLHRFCWLEDHEIGGAPDEWNWLEGWSDKRSEPPKAIHFTRGGPWMPNWQDVHYAKEWQSELATVPDSMRSSIGGR